RRIRGVRAVRGSLRAVSEAIPASRGLRPRLVIGSLLVALAILFVAALCIGRYPVHPATALRILGALATGSGADPAAPWTSTELVVIGTVRLPRVLVSAIAGAGLGLSGAALQGLFRNPLVGPQVAGISSGAAWGGVAALLVGAGAPAMVTSAFGFALLAL